MADVIYNYVRGIIPAGSKSGSWDIDNPYSATILAEDIKTALPNESLKVRCSGNSCDIVSPVTLSSGDEDILAAAVSDHQAITESDQLEINRAAKLLAIDIKTGQLIAAGFVYNDGGGNETFSASLYAQNNWNVLKNQEVEFTWPVEVSKKNGYKYNLTQANLSAFWNEGKEFIKGHLDTGRALKVLCIDAVDQAALDLVVDNR